jgi:sulfur-carrier protein
VATVRLRAPLRELAGGRSDHDVDGTTVRDVLRTLEHEYPAIAGWILDERVTIRQHINVFVNGERGREDTILAADDRIYVVPSISGG